MGIPIMPEAAGFSPNIEHDIAQSYLLHRDRIHRTVARSTRDPELAEDILHDAYVRLLLAVRAGNVPDNVPAWLYRVAMNLVVDSARRRSRLARLPIPDRSVVAPDDDALERERAAELYGALAKLPPDVRRALVLNGAGYGPVEIAPMIGRTSAATRVLLCRGRKRTRVLLADQLD